MNMTITAQQSPNEVFDVCSVASCASSTPSSDPSSDPSSIGSYVHNPYGSVSSKEYVCMTPVSRSPMSKPLETAEINVVEASGESEPTKKKKKGAGRLAWVILVQFKFGRTGRFYSNQPIERGTYVVVQADRGQDMGVVCGSEDRTPAHGLDKTIQKILKHANDTEIEKWVVTLSEQEKEATMDAQAMLDRQGISLTIAHAEYQYDGKKLTFHFTSKDAHPNFRLILDEAFSKWKCRIWFARYSRTVTDAECRRRMLAARSQ